VGWAIGPPAAGFETGHAPSSPPLARTFTDVSTGPVTAWSWDFGDGATSTLRHPQHEYAIPGTYTVALTVTGVGAENTHSREINVAPTAPVDFDADGDVDLADYGRFQTCFAGPGVEQPDEACSGARLDADTDVDADDFALFQLCLSGPDVPANPICAE
jgi:PKD repeat protein